MLPHSAVSHAPLPPRAAACRHALILLDDAAIVYAAMLAMVALVSARHSSMLLIPRAMAAPPARHGADADA